ncbi:MAG: phytoene desaturase family protein [Planctomycetota bacterium]|nr:phytoene desaturase family protein [Planctomycetota bacterium]
MSSTVIIVGGGLAGLSASVELSTLGCRVIVVERNAHLGGKMNILSESGYTFDMGPTILTLPQVLRGIIRRSGRKVEDWINLINLTPQWRCHYEDKTVIDLLAGSEPMAAALDRQFPGAKPGAGYAKFVEYSRRMMRLSEKVFFYKDVGGVFDMMKNPSKELGIMRDVLAMRMYSTVGATVHRDIAEPHVRQMCEHFLQYVGSSPFLAPAILSLIASAQVDHGCWYSMAPDGKSGGTRCVAKTLERIGREQGVEYITGVGVKSIRVKDGKATGVDLEDGRVILGDAVVSNCDVQRTYRDLIDDGAAKAEQRAIAADYTPACSGVVLYLGLKKQYPHLAHHNFLFSGNSEQEFDDIYAKGIPARDPTLYLAVPSRTDPTQAPAGCEAFYVLVHTAYKRGNQDWEGKGGLMEQYKPVIMAKLRRFGMEDIDQHIVVDRFLSPAGIERMYNAEGGAIYGLASHGKLKGGFKPRNRSRVVKGLYLAGGSANPGPGVPMVLMSGVTAARAAAHDLGVKQDEAIAFGQGVE